MVVEVQEAIERGLQRPPAREVLPPEGNAPVLVQNRLLQAFDEAVGPGVARRGVVRVTRMPSRSQPATKTPLNSLP